MIIRRPPTFGRLVPRQEKLPGDSFCDIYHLHPFPSL